MTWPLLLALWAVLMVLVLVFFRGARMLDEPPGPRSAEPTAEDIEWAKQVYAEIDRAARTRQDGPGSTIAGPQLSTEPPGPQAPAGPMRRTPR